MRLASEDVDDFKDATAPSGDADGRQAPSGGRRQVLGSLSDIFRVENLRSSYLFACGVHGSSLCSSRNNEDEGDSPNREDKQDQNWNSR